MNKNLCIFIWFFVGILIFSLIISHCTCDITEGYCCIPEHNLPTPTTKNCPKDIDPVTDYTKCNGLTKDNCNKTYYKNSPDTDTYTTCKWSEHTTGGGMIPTCIPGGSSEECTFRNCPYFSTIDECNKLPETCKWCGSKDHSRRDRYDPKCISKDINCSLTPWIFIDYIIQQNNKDNVRGPWASAVDQLKSGTSKSAGGTNCSADDVTVVTSGHRGHCNELYVNDDKQFCKLHDPPILPTQCWADPDRPCTEYVCDMKLFGNPTRYVGGKSWMKNEKSPRFCVDNQQGKKNEFITGLSKYNVGGHAVCNPVKI